VPPLPDNSVIAVLLPSVSILFSVVVAAWWSVAIIKMRAARRRLGVCDDGLRQSPSEHPVLVIIPAHNEERVIGSLIDSLKAQDHPPCRFVIALDRCTDATRAIALDRIAADPRFHIHDITHCPDGWAGKVHAIDAACRAAVGPPHELLLFADADTVFHPSCVRAALGLLSSRQLDMLSLLSTLTTERDFERSAQGPCVFELMRRYPPSLASRDADRRPFANGQFMLWTRAAYQRVGTHAAFGAELLEDLAMARAAWREKLRVQVIPAGQMLCCRMYPDRTTFRRGWRRIFTESANRKPTRLTSWSRAALVRGTFSPLALVAIVLASAGALFFAPTPLVSIACGFGVLALALWTAGLWTFLSHAGVRGLARWHALLAWPLGCLTLRAILLEAAADLRTNVPTRWGGMEYERRAR
jgi:cellulose synthase/poly-beta-1,6-N-acetylglucosamine synthase-like glycosyltransferase